MPATGVVLYVTETSVSGVPATEEDGVSEGLNSSSWSGDRKS